MILTSLQLHRGLHRLVIAIGARPASQVGGACRGSLLPRVVRGGPGPVITQGSYVGSVDQGRVTSTVIEIGGPA